MQRIDESGVVFMQGGHEVAAIRDGDYTEEDLIAEDIGMYVLKEDDDTVVFSNERTSVSVSVRELHADWEYPDTGLTTTSLNLAVVEIMNSDSTDE